MNALSVSVPEFARVLQAQLGRVVVDGGAFDFRLTWNPDSSVDGTGPTIFTVLQEQYRLRLESRKGLVEIIVVDHIERPSEN